MTDAGSFDGKRALVTAASKGLGLATATELVERGARVAILSRDPEHLVAARESIRDAAGVSDAVITAPADLAEPTEVRRAITESIEELGGLDVLVTNHGGPAVQPIAETSVEALDDAYESVLRGTFVILQTALPELEDGGGSIVNIVSATVREPLSGDVLQNLLRPGIYALSKALSREYGPEVRVNCLCPRGVLTDRIEYKVDLLAEREGIGREAALDRRTEELAVDDLGTPEEFARAVAFLAGEEASYITGAFLPIDGGWSRGAF